MLHNVWQQNRTQSCAKTFPRRQSSPFRPSSFPFSSLQSSRGWSHVHVMSVYSKLSSSFSLEWLIISCPTDDAHWKSCAGVEFLLKCFCWQEAKHNWKTSELQFYSFDWKHECFSSSRFKRNALDSENILTAQSDNGTMPLCPTNRSNL